jgi:hypothetical protein
MASFSELASKPRTTFAISVALPFSLLTASFTNSTLTPSRTLPSRPAAWLPNLTMASFRMASLRIWARVALRLRREAAS